MCKVQRTYSDNVYGTQSDYFANARWSLHYHIDDMLGTHEVFSVAKSVQWHLILHIFKSQFGRQKCFPTEIFVEFNRRVLV